MGLYNKNKIRNKNIERFLLIVFGFISLSIILPTQSQTRFLSSLSLNIGIETESFDTVYGEDKEFKTPPTSPQTGSIHLLIHEVDANGNHLGFFNGVTVKLTDPSGETVYQTTISEHNNACEGCNDYEDGWVWFDDIAPGTYGIMAYKDGFQGKAKQADCLTNWTLIDTTIQNSNTENLIAAWDNEVPVSKNNITWCQDLGLMEVSFITPPSVSTNSATNIETNQTTLNGNLTDLGGANTAHVWFVWDTESHNNGDDYADNNRNENIVMDDIGIFDKTITGLSPDTTYHFRAVAETPGGIVYGIDKTFNTLPLPVQCQHNDGVCLEGCTPENDNDCQPYQELGKTISFGSEEGKYPYSPWVMHEPGWESYLIYFIDNYDMQDRISRIENWTDGKTDWDWINRSIVLEGVNPEDKDYLSGSPGVVIDSQETWHMYYVTASGEPGASMILYLHHAVAQAPGINWTKLGKIQIQNVTQPFPSYIETPSPLLIDNKIVLYYVTDTVVRGIRKGKLMKTTSTDGHHFSEPMAVNIADDFVQAGHVKYINGIYYYVYSRNLTDPSQYATHNFLSISTDGINFSKGELLFHRGEETEESDWDSWRAWAPDLLIEDNVLRVYYAGSKYGIGYYNIGLRWFSRSDQICPDCTIERECRNHVVKACTADNAKDHDISGLGNSIDDYWCTYNEHDGCSYAKSGVELVNGQVLQEDPNSNHSWWEGDACGEGEGTSNLYGEKKVYVDDINKYNIKTRVKIDDNSWVWINGQEAPGLHRGCCDWTDWVDTASYLNTGWNTIKFRAEDTCSGGRHFNMDWDVSLKQQQAVHEIPVLEIKYFPDENNDGRLDQEETGRNDTLNSIRTEVRNL
ncbi:MAG: carboxypeptidase regulatory-like domain-containing protein, partial [Candidatus Cloacimonetes bacterium]|nr:carboxypeptidase regulatory-like domain-containing protein [Candidatus Cloacimonadota bacterium]